MYKDTLIRQDIPRAWRVSLRSWSRLVLSLECAGFKHPSPVELTFSCPMSFLRAASVGSGMKALWKGLSSECEVKSEGSQLLGSVDVRKRRE